MRVPRYCDDGAIEIDNSAAERGLLDKVLLDMILDEPLAPMATPVPERCAVWQDR